MCTLFACIICATRLDRKVSFRFSKSLWSINITFLSGENQRRSLHAICGPGYPRWYSDLLRATCSVDWIPVATSFSRLVYTRHGAHPSSDTVATELLPKVCAVIQVPPPNTNKQTMLNLYIHTHSIVKNVFIAVSFMSWGWRTAGTCSSQIRYNTLV